MRPPGIKDTWEDNSTVRQAELLSYDQIRQLEEVEMATLMARASMAAGL
jgi:hypothetical protein